MGTLRCRCGGRRCNEEVSPRLWNEGKFERRLRVPRRIAIEFSIEKPVQSFSLFLLKIFCADALQSYLLWLNVFVYFEFVIYSSFYKFILAD